MSRGEGGRGHESRRSNLRGSFRDTGAVRVSLSEAAKVHRVTDDVLEKAELHYHTHRETWIARH